MRECRSCAKFATDICPMDPGKVERWRCETSPSPTELSMRCTSLSWLAMFDARDAVFFRKQKFVADNHDSLSPVQRRLSAAWQSAALTIDHVGGPRAAIARANGGLNQMRSAALQIDHLGAAESLPQIQKRTAAAQCKEIVRLARGGAEMTVVDRRAQTSCEVDGRDVHRAFRAEAAFGCESRVRSLEPREHSAFAIDHRRRCGRATTIRGPVRDCEWLAQIFSA